MAILDNRLDAPATVAFSTLAPGDVFRSGANFYIKIVAVPGFTALNLTSFALENISGVLAVSQVDAYIDEVEPAP